MTLPEALAAQLGKFIGGQTLATLRIEASKEMNGTCFKSLRSGNGPRWILLACVTGEHELRKIGNIGSQSQQQGDWKSINLADALTQAMKAGGFCFFVDSSSQNSFPPIAFIAAGPDAVKKLERVLGLQA